MAATSSNNTVEARTTGTFTKGMSGLSERPAWDNRVATPWEACAFGSDGWLIVDPFGFSRLARIFDRKGKRKMPQNAAA